jgi:hypothetical protein
MSHGSELKENHDSILKKILDAQVNAKTLLKKQREGNENILPKLQLLRELLNPKENPNTLLTTNPTWIQRI